MNVRKSPFLTAIQALAAEERPDDEMHPDVEDLLAYRDRILPEDQRESLQEHLALCHECTGLILDYENFLAPDSQSDPCLGAEQIAADRHALEKRLGRREDGFGELLEFRNSTLPTRATAPRQSTVPAMYFQLVAALLVATVGLTSWVVVLYQRLAELDGPRTNISVHTLLGTDAQPMRGLASANNLPSSTADEGVMLILASGRLTTDSAFRLELLGLEKNAGEKEALWSYDGLRRDPEGRFTLTIPSRYLNAGGDYVIRIYVLDGEGEELFEEYVFRLASE